jgi:AcrR family transcriptional regulator
MPPRDADATRARILAAAVEEFAAFGLAGARVDRIAEAAEANKRSIYVYYGDKEALFQAALDHVIDRFERVDLDDLPGWAGRLFDHLLAHPEAWRLYFWMVLERPDAKSGHDDVTAARLEAMADPRQGAVTGGLAIPDVIALIVGLTRGWFMTPHSLLASGGLDPASEERRAIHREAIVETVRRMIAPGGGPEGA